MGKKTDRESMNAMVDDGTALYAGSILHLEGDNLVLDAEVEFEAGTPVTIFPMGQEHAANLFELPGRVIQSCPDILVSAFAKNRYLLTVGLTASDEQRAALERAIAEARPAGDPRTRQFTEPHRDGLFSTAPSTPD